MTETRILERTGDCAPEPRPARLRSIELRAPSVRRAYLRGIANALRDEGHAVRVGDAGVAALPATVDWLLFFERITYRAPAQAFGRETEPFASDFTGEPDLIVDLVGDAPRGPTPVLRLCFDTGPGEVGLVAALIEGRAPALTFVRDQVGHEPKIVLQARLAAEQPRSLGRALDAAAKRLATLIAQAVARSDDARERGKEEPTADLSIAAPLRFAARSLAGKIIDRITDHARRDNHWRIAWRRIEGPGVMDALCWGGGWRGLPDGGGRYFADPFLFAHAGRLWLFCEEYPYATGKGILSVSEIDADGRPGAPRPCLETPTHLSWPQVFAHNGAVYMIPESVGANRVELWRATEFPYRWALDRVLLDGVRAHDPLLHIGESGAYLIATLDGDGGSSWDALGLFTAPGLFGPWRPHGGNPLLVDAGAARPAGPFVAKADGLWRPAQDCRGGYGVGLALCRVTRLDQDGYAQEVVAQLGPPPLPGAVGAHSLYRLDELEAIDMRGARLTLQP